MFSIERIRRYMGSNNREIGNYLMNLMDSSAISRSNSDLRNRNIALIRWLEEHDAPAELIEQCKFDDAQGYNVVLDIVEELHMRGTELLVIPAEVVELLLDSLGPVTSAYLIQLCDECDRPAGESDYIDRRE